MKALEKRINEEIGLRYVAAALWSNIATPVNLAITLMTSVTTGQATTDNLIRPDIYKALSMLNTFFRPGSRETLKFLAPC